MKKIIVTLICILSSVNIATAKNLPNVFDKAFSDTRMSKHVVSISIQDIIFPIRFEVPLVWHIFALVPPPYILHLSYDAAYNGNLDIQARDLF